MAVRRLPLPLALLLLLAASAGPSLAQDVGELSDTHHEVIVQEATVDVRFEPDLALLDIDPNPECNDVVEVNVVAGFFQVDEGNLQSSCFEVAFPLSVPPGGTFLEVEFTSNRTVNNTIGGPLPDQPPVEQYYVLESTNDVNFSIQINYYDPTSGSSGPRVFRDSYLLPPGLDGLRMVWHFQDLGRNNPLPDQGPIPTGQAFDATVSRLNFTWQRLPLGVGPAEAMPERPDESGTRGIIDYVLRTTVPDGEQVAPEAFDRNVALRDTTTSLVRIAVASGLTLEDVVAPGGPLREEEFTLTEGGGRLAVEIPESTLEVRGPGDYELAYQSVRVLPPTPPLEDPTRIYAFYFVLAFLPMVAAALAIHQTSLYVKQAEGPYRRTAWPIAAAVGLVILYYLILLGYSLFSIGPRTMSTLPLAREAVLVYIQFVLLLIMLSAAALAVSRTLMGSMRRDLEERQRKEDQLRRSNEELERFAYVASHDLQEPLRKVAGFTALLQKKYAGRLDSDADEIIGYAVDGATRMQMLIKDILAYSRVGSRELQRVQVDANAVMELVTADLGDAIKESKARISWHALPTVRADASQLRQVLQNLVENAIKYSKPGKRPVVQVTGGADGDAWHFEVKDNGIGIPPDKHEEIFGIFRRLHGQDTRGTGIGLAVAKKAIERHGGKIWVDSKPGHGSTFHFTLPRGAFDGAGNPTPLPGRRGAASGAGPA